MRKGRKREFSRIRMIQLAMQGQNRSQIAKELGCTAETVSRRLRQLYLFKRGYKGVGEKPHFPKPMSRREQIAPAIVNLYHEGFNMKEIQRILRSTPRLVREVLDGHGLDTSRERGHAMAMLRRYCEDSSRLVGFLEEHGPQHLRDMKINPVMLQQLKEDDRVQLLRFKIGLGRSAKKDGPPRKLTMDKPTVWFNIVTTTDDSRLPEWVASQVPWSVDDKHQASTIMQCLRTILGRTLAVVVIEKMGYEYQSDPIRQKSVKARPRDSPRQLLDHKEIRDYVARNYPRMTQAEIAEKLGVTSGTISQTKKFLEENGVVFPEKQQRVPGATKEDQKRWRALQALGMKE